MKLLFISNIAGEKVGSFSLASIMAAKELGYEYHMAANFMNSSAEQMKSDEEKYGIHLHQIDFERNPLNRANKKAYRQIKELMEQEQFDAIHCNTPIGGLTGRIAGKKCHVPNVIYQAHGFHFYKGAPLKNWLLYYPVEWLCAHWTDVLITINQEDYSLAQKRMKAKKICYVPGVGIDFEKFGNAAADKAEKRKELGIPDDATLVLSVGELSHRKNHVVVLHAVAEMENIYYIIAGKGELENYLQETSKKLGVAERVKLLGHRTDIAELCAATDIFALPSIQEGLPRSMMEAMAGGLPAVCSRIRGNTDLLDENGGALFAPYSVEECRKAIQTVQAGDRAAMGRYNKEKVKAFSIENVFREMREIYRTCIK